MALFSWLEAWLRSTREQRLEILNAPVAPPETIVPAAPRRPLIAPLAPRFAIPFCPSPDFKPMYEVARRVELVVLHCTESSWSSALGWLTLEDEHKVSAHYLVGKDGRIEQMVAANDVAYHAA